MLRLLTTKAQTQRFMKTISTLSCWYSMDSSRRVLSNEYLLVCDRVSIMFLLFLHHFVLAKLATTSIRVRSHVDFNICQSTLINQQISIFDRPCDLVRNPLRREYYIKMDQRKGRFSMNSVYEGSHGVI